MGEEPVRSVIYETLSPLSLAAFATPATLRDSSPFDDTFEPYSVFRNEISLSTGDASSTATAAPDFFSLDVGSEKRGGILDSSSRRQASEGVPQTPVREAEPKLESGWFSGNNRFKSPMLQLHKEIVDFCDFLSPTPEEKTARNTAIERVFDVVKHIWPHCNVEVFGSFSTGLYLPTSDIDVVILGSGTPTPQLGLRALSRGLSRSGVAKKIQVIGKARVPIIKFVETKSDFSFDISFDVQNGPKATDFIKNAMAKWPPLRPLCLILKVFLQQRDLNEVYSGGLGSYALLTMIIAMLQNLYGSQHVPEQNLGSLLVHFFDFYGRKLNASDVGVTCSGTHAFFSKTSRGFVVKGRPSLISIEDPQTPDNDIGKNSFNYFQLLENDLCSILISMGKIDLSFLRHIFPEKNQIKSAFATAYTSLTNHKIILNLGPSRSILGTIIRPDPVFLDRKGGSNGEMTFNMLLPGAGQPLQQLYEDPQEIMYNWQHDDDEPFPRWNSDVEKDGGHSSGKKRKGSSKESSRKKMKENGDRKKTRQKENGSIKEKSSKKRLKKLSHDHSNGYSHQLRGPSWSQ